MNDRPAHRPKSIDADGKLNIRIDQDTKNALVVLASNWQCNASQAVRKAIKIAANWPDASK